MEKTMKYDHTFAICAYKESKYLEECINTLLNQTMKSKIYISTSTPNEHISRLAEKYDLPVYVNTGIKGITGDWNFAMSQADTKYVTIAHQDDVYEPTYTEELIKRAEKAKNPIIIFSDYFELRDGEKVFKNKLLKIKRMMNFFIGIFPNSRFMRNRVLSVGNSICCPAVMYSMEAYKDFQFDNSFKTSCDWEAWSRLALIKGAFIYHRKPLMGHRIHEESETTATIADNTRNCEDLIIYERYWPSFIAKMLIKPYSQSQKSNNIK